MSLNVRHFPHVVDCLQHATHVCKACLVGLLRIRIKYAVSKFKPYFTVCNDWSIRFFLAKICTSRNSCKHLGELFALSPSFRPTNRCLEIVWEGADVLILCTLTNVRCIQLLSFDDALTVHPVEGTRRDEWVWKLSVRLADVDSGRAIRFLLIQLIKPPFNIISASISLWIPLFGLCYCFRSITWRNASMTRGQRTKG